MNQNIVMGNNSEINDFNPYGGEIFSKVKGKIVYFEKFNNYEYYFPHNNIKLLEKS